MTRAPDPALFIEALVAGFPPEERDGRWMIMLQACIDDSGSEPSSPAYVLAGFLANVSQWKRFAAAWQAKLQEEPPIQYFKASEAMALDGQFQGWPRALRDKKVFELAEIAHAHIEARAECTMFRAEYDAIVPMLADTPILNDPYFTCFYALIFQVNAFHKRLGLAVNSELDFIFDDQGHIGQFAAGWWPRVKQWASPDRAKLLGSPPIFRDDKKFLPLQAGDLYAWFVRRRLLMQAQEQNDLMNAIFKLFADKFPVRTHLGREYLLGLGATIVVSDARTRGVLGSA